MTSKRYTEEFKIEAVKQVTERGHGIYSVASRLGVTHSSLYTWLRRYGNSPEQHVYEAITDQQAEINRLKAELKRVTEERDILKKATAYFAKESL
jgi:transposase-like protein